MRLGLAMLLLAASASARPALAPADDLEAAKAHYAAGSAYYEQANYSDALREFSEAFRLSNRTDLLYNIAVCQERIGRVDDAIGSLKRYLVEKPNAPDRNLIEGRIASLEQQRRPAPIEPPPTPVVPPPVVAPVTPVQPQRPHHWWVPGTAVSSVGAALLVVALGTGLASNAVYDDLTNKCPSGVCPSSLKSEANRGSAEAITTDVMIGVGAATLATGVIVLIVQSRRPAAPISARAGSLVLRF
jgi:tetratricopeptide (TPR) repeat protein